MADYGYYKGNKKQKRFGRKRDRTASFDKSDVSWGVILLRMIDILVGVLSIILAVVFFVALFARWVNPEKMSFFSVVGLFYPFIYVANIVCMLYWSLRWSKMFWLSFAVIFFGLGSVKMFYRPEITKKYQEQSSEYEQVRPSGFTVMSYNVQGFYGIDRNDQRDNYVKQISNLANEKAAAIICFQEFYKNDNNLDILDSSLENMRYSVFVNYEEKAPSADGSGLAIYSVYPIVNSGVVDMEMPRIHSLWADVKIDRDTVRVISNHLQNHYITQKDRKETITRRLINDTAVKEKVMVLSRKLAANYKLRAFQARKLHEFIKSSPYQVVVCGDFNDTAASYAYHQIRKRLQDTFIERGAGFVHTYNEFGNVLRIDYILVSRGFKVNEYEVPDVGLSDHSPVLSIITLENHEEE